MFVVFGAGGVFTPIIESAAAAVGAGVILGGFVGASAGMASGWSRRQVEGDALRDTYHGAALALTLWLLDQCIVYATSI
jgi:hypothetical protein